MEAAMLAYECNPELEVQKHVPDNMDGIRVGKYERKISHLP